MVIRVTLHVTLRLGELEVREFRARRVHLGFRRRIMRCRRQRGLRRFQVFLDDRRREVSLLLLQRRVRATARHLARLAYPRQRLLHIAELLVGLRNRSVVVEIGRLLRDEPERLVQQTLRHVTGSDDLRRLFEHHGLSLVLEFVAERTLPLPISLRHRLRDRRLAHERLRICVHGLRHQNFIRDLERLRGFSRRQPRFAQRDEIGAIARLQLAHRVERKGHRFKQTQPARRLRHHSERRDIVRILGQQPFSSFQLFRGILLPATEHERRTGNSAQSFR